MPNHVTNRLEILGTKEQIDEIVRECGTLHARQPDKTYNGDIMCKNRETNEFGWFSEKDKKFKTRNLAGGPLKEQPAESIPDGWDVQYVEEILEFPDFNKVIPQPENIFKGDLCISDEERFKSQGIPTWYSWNIENWGTKWSGYRFVKESDNVYLFDTAWSSVPKIIEAMGRKFPDVIFICEYADEDVGNNAGKIETKSNQCCTLCFPPNSDDAYEMAFKLGVAEREEYEKIGGEWKYIDEEE